MTATPLPLLAPWRSAREVDTAARPGSATGESGGVTWSVHVEDARALRPARRAVRRAVLDALAAASPVHASELVRARAAAAPAVPVSPLLGEVLRTAFSVAADTDGAYDPGAREETLHGKAAALLAGCGRRRAATPAPDWRSASVNGDNVRLGGAALSLLPLAYAVAARRVAERTAAEWACGAYAVIGDVAAAAALSRTVHLWELPLAPNGSVARVRASDVPLAEPRWREVCVAADGAAATALARAAYAWGPDAPEELAARGVSARLVAQDETAVWVTP